MNSCLKLHFSQGSLLAQVQVKRISCATICWKSAINKGNNGIILNSNKIPENVFIIDAVLF